MDFYKKISPIDPIPFEKVYKEFYMDKAKRLGHGGFGKVYLIEDRTSKKVYAAKYQKLAGNKVTRLVRDEAEVLQHLSSRKSPSEFVMITYGYYEKNIHSLLVTEYLEGGELFAKITDPKYSLTEKKCCGFVKQIVQGLNYIHEMGILHLDIKPQNIMMTSRDKDVIKLIDFGLAKKLEVNKKVRIGFVGTIGFMAPEVLRCTQAEPATDFFSLGVVAYMLLSGGYEPFWYKDERRTIKRTLDREVTFDQNMQKVSDLAKKFIKGVLEKRCEKRLHGAECYSHPWLQGAEVDMNDSILDTARLRGYMARMRWAKAIKAVRFTVKMTLSVPDKSRPDFTSQEIPVQI